MDSEMGAERPERPEQAKQSADETAFAVDEGEEEPQPLAVVRYGLGKEIRLFPDAIAIVMREEAEEVRFRLESIHRLILSPGEYNPGKLVLMFDMDDDTTVIAAEGMTNARDFRTLLAVLQDIHPEIELDPPDMREQLAQALEIRGRHLIGCYAAFIGSCVLFTIVFLAVAWIGGHAPR